MTKLARNWKLPWTFVLTCAWTTTSPVTVYPHLRNSSLHCLIKFTKLFNYFRVPICIAKPLEHESIAVQTDIEPHDIINPDTPETDNEDSALKVFFESELSKNRLNVCLFQDAKTASMQEQWAIENQEAADMKRALEESIADLDPFQHRPDAKVVYKLSAVVNHYGATPSSGAYQLSLSQ